MDSIDDYRAAAAAALTRGDASAAAQVFVQLAAALATSKTAALEAAQGLRRCGDFARAAAVLEAALLHAPRSMGLLDMLAAAYGEMGAPARAAGVIARMADVAKAAAKAAPADPQPWIDLGRLRMRLGQGPAAVAAFRRAFALSAVTGDVHHVFGTALLNAGQAPAAATHLNAAARLYPGDTTVMLALGQAQKAGGDLAAAAATFQRVLALDPGHAPGRAALAEVTARAEVATAALLDKAADADRRGIFALARENYQTVLHREPGQFYALSRLLTLDGYEGRLDDADTHHKMLIEALERTDLAAAKWEYLALIARQHAVRPLPDPLYAAVTQALDRQLVTAMHPRRGSAAKMTGRRLRIGYLSGLFRDNPVGHVTAALFAAHDRARVEAHVFYCPDVFTPNLYTDAIRKGAEHFITLKGDPRRMADAIAARDLDILIFIGGYTESALLQAVAARPAPIQVFWLGHAGNCDVSAIDYFLADATVVPPGEEGLYRAKVARLPAFYHCASPHRIGGPVTRADAGLPDEGFVFCAFNNTEKIDNSVFAVWMNILRRVDRGVLWLSHGLSPAVTDNLRMAAEAQGIDGARLIFAPRLPDKAVHLARHRLCGLHLDTFLINAHTTALDALWAGLPVLTVEGSRFGSRFGASALRTIGLEDLVMPDAAAYEDRAVHLATTPDALDDLRGRLAANLYTAPLFRPEIFCRGLEDCLEQIHAATLA